MTQLFVHPEINDYFVEYDFRSAQSDPRIQQQVVDDYFSEKVILLRNLKFDADIQFLRGVSFYQKWKWKKLALSNFELIPKENHRETPEIAEFVHDVFDDDWSRFNYFLDQAEAVNQQIRAAVGALFANFTFKRRDIIWRFTETRVENLHFDLDRNCDNLELIRFYANLDDIPRIWYTSTTFSPLARAWYRKLKLGRFRDQPNDKLLKELTTRVFGDWHSRGRDMVPRHLVMFEPGDVWLTDGRQVTHQVIYGRRVVSSLFIADSDTVPDPKFTFKQKVANLHQSALLTNEFETDGEGQLTEKKKAAEAKKPLDLRVAWESLPERERNDTIVRI